MTRYEKIAQMKPEQKNHWIDIPELSYWGERIFGEIAVAEELSQGRYDALLERAVDCLYEGFLKEHALPDSLCRKAEEILSPLSAQAKECTLHCVAHAHIDMDWMWGFHETVDIVLGTFRTMLDLMDQYPDFVFCQSQCAVYRMVEFYDPALFRRVKKRVDEGRFVFAGSSFVELDKNMPNLESMARHILYTRQFLQERFGISYEKINLDFHPDSFGHSASAPDILAAGGVRYFYHCRGLDGQQLYRWRGASGKEVLALNEPLWYNDSIRPMYLCRVPAFCRQYGIKDMMKVYGVGDHGGGPTRKDIELILDMQTWPVAPKLIFSTYDAYFAAIDPYRENFPVVTGELGPTFTGCYTSQSKIKLANRVAEDRLYLAEALTAFAVREAELEHFNRQFRAAWEKVLFNQFHDILPGSNTPESRDHAMGAFEEAMGGVMAASGAALRAFAEKIDTSMFETPDENLLSRSEGGGVGLGLDETSRFRLPGVERGRGKTRLLHFFNPTPFDRAGIQEIALWDWPGDPERLCAFDVNGQPVPCSAETASTLEWNHTRTTVLLEAAAPAFGYTTVRLAEAPKESFCFSALPPDPRVTYFQPLVLENEKIRVELEENDLSIRSFVDKKSGRRLLENAGFFLCRERTNPGGCGWREGVETQPQNLHRSGKVIFKEAHFDGLRRWISYEIQFGASKMVVTLRLDKAAETLEILGDCDFQEKAAPDGTPKVSFCARLAYPVSGYQGDIQIGVLHREASALHDSCARNFYFAQEKEAGMLLLSDGKYGYRGYGNALQVSLLRGSSRPDPYPELGKRRFRLGLRWEKAEPLALKKAGEAFVHSNLPYASNTAHPGVLPLTRRFLTLEGNAVVSAVKVPESGKGLLVRLAAVSREEEAAVRLAAPGFQKAMLVDFSEQVLENRPMEQGVVSLILAPGETVGILFV